LHVGTEADSLAPGGATFASSSRTVSRPVSSETARGDRPAKLRRNMQKATPSKNRRIEQPAMSALK